MTVKISSLPNYYNGKLYKRWDSVKDLFNNGTIFATRTTKDNKVIQLMISEGGKKRELLYPDGKVMDIVYDDNSQYTYVYERIGDVIKGSMSHTAPLSGQDAPLIKKARWFLRRFVLDKIFLSLNLNHPGARVFIPSGFLKAETNEFFGIGKRVMAKNIIARDFSGLVTNTPIPRYITIRTPDNHIETIDCSSGDYNKKLAKQLGIYSQELGNNIRTVV